MATPTPHISAMHDDFAKTVLMPGDPLRAKFMAENYLESPIKINGIRGMLGYTGTYNGKPISIMGSGMGCPSIGIYSYELFNFYKVDNIIRIGSAGAIHPNLELGDVIMGIGACTNSNYPADFSRVPGIFAPTASYTLLSRAQKAAEMLNIPITIGNILTSDVFYNDDNVGNNAWLRMGVLAVEMEAAALYTNAARASKNALCICTISDKIFANESIPAEDREKSFTRMMEIALAML